MFWATYFHSYSLTMRLRKDKFSRQHFQKISRTPNVIVRNKDGGAVMIPNGYPPHLL